MAIQILHAVIHGFTKDPNTTVVSAKVKKDKLLDVAMPAVASLVTGVNGLLGKPGNILSYGQFDDDMRQGRFPTSFDDYLAAQQRPAEFLTLSQLTTDELADQAALEPLATGGNILVASYTSGGALYFLVAMIKQRGGLVLDDDYVPTEIVEIDLSKVQQAARISIGRYKQVRALPLEALGIDDVVPEDRTYLSFVGRTSNTAAGYFVKALGCTKGVGSSRATSNVIKAVASYFSPPELKHVKQVARNCVFAYLQEKLDKGEDAQLSEIAHCATACLEAKQEIHLEPFKEFLNGENGRVPAAFKVHGLTLKKNTRIKAESASWSVQFERGSLGRTPNSSVFFDENHNTLTVKGLDSRTIAEILAELAQREG